MTKLTASHLGPLARAFAAALREGAITTQEAKDFCYETFNSVLEYIVDEGKSGNNAERPQRVRATEPAGPDTSPGSPEEAQDGVEAGAGGSGPRQRGKGRGRRG